MKTILYPGRFQPFHNAHLKMIKNLSDDYNVVILIGSAQESYTKRNPFDCYERWTMIKRALKHENISNYRIIPLPDINYPEKWVEYIEAVCGDFDAVLSNNLNTRKLFTLRGHEVVETSRLGDNNIRGTAIRNQISQCSDEWEQAVPKVVVDYIKEIDGEKRIRRLE